MNDCLSCGKPVKNKFCNTTCVNRYYNKFQRRGTLEYEKSLNTRLGKLKEYERETFEDVLNKIFEIKRKTDKFWGM